MTNGSALEVDSELSIPRHELTFRATRAGGPGGQHVNTSSTRVELLWNLERSRAPSPEQRQRLRVKLGGRLDADGNVRIVASSYRSQLRNREDAAERLAKLLKQSLAVPKSRRKTRPTKSSIESRLATKRKQTEKKRRRQSPDLD